MTRVADANIADIRKRGRETRTLVVIVFAVALAGVVGEVVIAPLAHLARGEGANAAALSLRDNVIGVMPTAFLLWGLWHAQRVFGRVEHGDIFAAENAAGVGKIGEALGWCAFAHLVMVPTIRAWVTRSGGFDFNLEAWAIVLGALGGAIALFGRIWALAVEIKTEADQII